MPLRDGATSDLNARWPAPLRTGAGATLPNLMPGMVKTMGRENSSSGVVGTVFSYWYTWAAAAAALSAAGGAAYWYREQIGDSYASVQDDVLAAVGLGIAPAVIWTAALLWAAIWKRDWLRRANRWAGALLLAAFSMSALAFLAYNDGALTTVTRTGEVSLGGNLGSAIIGETNWQGGLRAAALLVVAGLAVFPGIVMESGRALLALLVYAYVFSVVGLRATYRALRSMYRYEPQTGSTEHSSPRVTVEPRHAAPPTRSGLESYTPQDWMTDSEHSEAEREPALDPVPANELGSSVDASFSGSDVDQRSPEKDDQGLEVPGTADPELEPVGKYNRFWSEENGASGHRNGHDKAAETGLGPTAVSGAASTLGDTSGAAVNSWARPSINLLVDAPEGGISQEDMAETSEIIRRTLADYGVEVEIGQTRPGPAVTMYGLVPGWVRKYKQAKVTDADGKPKLDEAGKPMTSRVESRTRVKVDTILSREKDLALALKTPSLRIETPAMGKSLVGIEVPNPSPDLITLRGVMESEEFKKLRKTAKLPIALGKGSGGETVVVDLAKMPHLLVAGATGSGKSVCINTIVTCLAMEKSPEEMRLLLVDPKRVELTPYNGIPHLLTPVVVETDQVVALLKGLIREMLDRYRSMEEVGVRNIEAYNEKMSEKMPYIVVGVDELADLMMSASFDVEQSLCRLAQLGRATGIHLIVATQRPSVDVVTGLIKANFPSRISFGVTSQIDSRTILDTVGAEKLLGRGDMLYQAVDASRPTRAQGVFVSDQEIDGVVRFWQTTPRGPLPNVSLHTVGDGDTEGEGSDGNDQDESRDELLDKAIEMAHIHKKVSTSLLQRRMRIGYPRAARLMDQLEDEGIVGPSDGSKSRDVIIGQT